MLYLFKLEFTWCDTVKRNLKRLSLIKKKKIKKRKKKTLSTFIETFFVFEDQSQCIEYTHRASVIVRAYIRTWTGIMCMYRVIYYIKSHRHVLQVLRTLADLSWGRWTLHEAFQRTWNHIWAIHFYWSFILARIICKIIRLSLVIFE